jgi:electron transfer flavoprotein alpha subunit
MILVLTEHFKGEIMDSTFELLGKGRELADKLGVKLCALLLGNNACELAGKLGIADTVLYVEDQNLAEFNPEAYKMILNSIIKERKPRLTMFSSTSQSYDISSIVSFESRVPFVSNCVDIKAEGTGFLFTCQSYGGKILVDISVTEEQSMGAFLTGAFSSEGGKSSKESSVEKISSPVPLTDLKITFKKLIEPEGGDIDISKQSVLISIGRGVQNQDNVQEVEELATLLQGALSGSRPVIDQKWLPKTRQVGKSGMHVKPKIYLAAGISGAPEHVEGMKDAEIVISINTDPNAPIFNVSDYGVVSDMFDIIGPLKDELSGRIG